MAVLLLGAGVRRSALKRWLRGFGCCIKDGRSLAGIGGGAPSSAPGDAVVPGDQTNGCQSERVFSVHHLTVSAPPLCTTDILTASFTPSPLGQTTNTSWRETGTIKGTMRGTIPL